MPGKSEQSELTIDNSLKQISNLEMDSISKTLGLQKCSDGYRFDFFNRSILYDFNDFSDLSGEGILPAVKSIFCQYLLRGSKNQIKGSGRLVTFREFSGAGPLFSRFSENTNKTIEHSFSNKLALLEEKCGQLYGMPVDDTSYDLSLRFKALPRVPVIFQFNDADDILPANSAMLFHDDAENYLDLKSLAAIGTYLTGMLIQSVPSKII